MVALEYLTKWTEAKVVKTNTAAHVATFMYKIIIFRFGCPKILVGGKGTCILNLLIYELIDRF